MGSSAESGDASAHELAALHSRLVDGDPVAPALLAQHLLPALTRRTSSWKDSAVESVESVLGEVIADYLSSPHDYDPSGAPLVVYLYRRATWRLTDAHRGRRRETAARAVHDPSEPFELGADGTYPSVEEEALERVDPFDRPDIDADDLRDEIGSWPQDDREVAQLMADGERSTAAYAVILGVDHLPVGDQRRVVKRAKDRISKRFEKLRGSR